LDEEVRGGELLKQFSEKLVNAGAPQSRNNGKDGDHV
jgi:hypothetical protein